MSEQPPKKRFDEVFKDPDEGLFKDIGPDHKFNRLRTTDPKRLGRRAKLTAIRAIDITTGKTRPRNNISTDLSTGSRAA